MVLNGNDLYIAEFIGNKISKFDITSPSPTVTDVITNLNGPFSIAFSGNDLYIAEFSGNKISKIDITDSTPTATEIISGLNGPRGVQVVGDDLYIAEVSTDKILKIKNFTLSNPEFHLDPNIVLYPNPSNDFIEL